MGVIIFIGILVSDHMASQREHAQLLGGPGTAQADRAGFTAPSLNRAEPLPEPQPPARSSAEVRRPRQTPAPDPTERAVRRNGEQIRSVIALNNNEAADADAHLAVDEESAAPTRSEASTVEPAIIHIGPSAPAAAPATHTRDRFHMVQPDENLSSIAAHYYGDANYWQMIYEANRDTLPSADQLQVGMRLRIPNRAGQVVEDAPQSRNTASTVPQYESYTIRRGDTLSRLAERYYGSTGDWRKLYELNRQVIRDPDALQVGATIRVPRR
jgi:nucleoid-associated protein YgaU